MYSYLFRLLCLFSLCPSSTANAQEIESLTDAYSVVKERLVYIEARAIASYEACDAGVQGPVKKGTGLLLNDTFVITAYHNLNLAITGGKKHCFLVYRETDRAIAISGTPKYVSGSPNSEVRLRLGDQDLALFSLGRPVLGLEKCLPLISEPPAFDSIVHMIGYNGQEIQLQSGRPIGDALRETRKVGQCKAIGVCDLAGNGIPAGLSGSPLINPRGELVGVAVGDNSGVGTKFESLAAVRGALLDVCKGRYHAPKTYGLEVVDVLFAKHDATQFPVLDVKLRNTGEVAFIKEALFDVSKVWQVKTGWEPGNQCVTWNYDVVLPVLGTPNPVRLKMSQEIKKGESDRFTFTLGNDAPPGLVKYAFLVDLTLVYDGDEKRLSLPRLFFVAESAKETLARNSSGDFAAAFKHNVQVVEELGPFVGLMNEEAQRLVHNYSPRVVPTYVGLLGSKLPTKRRNAARTLGWLGSKAEAALSTLQEIAKNDVDAEVRKVALSSSEEIKKQLVARAERGYRPPLPLTINKDEILGAKNSCFKMEPADKNQSKQPTNPQDGVPDAEELLELGHYSEAILAATKEIDAGDQMSRFTRGRAYLGSNQNKEAVDDFTFLIDHVFAEDGWMWANRALGYTRLKEFVKARADYNKAVLLGRREDGIFAARGRFLLQMREPANAVADFRKAISEEPEVVSYYGQLGIALITAEAYSDIPLVVEQIRELATQPAEQKPYLLLAEILNYVAQSCSGNDPQPDMEGRSEEMAKGIKGVPWASDGFGFWAAQTTCARSTVAKVTAIVGQAR